MTDDGDDVGYTVGYCKPPKQSQFKKGKSGNDKGRRKGSKNVATVLHNELNQRVAITEYGKHRTITKLEATIKQMINKAAAGDLRAMRTVLQISKDIGDLKIADVNRRTVITMNIPPALPGEDRSYRDISDHPNKPIIEE
jgi:ribosomal protein S25